MELTKTALDYINLANIKDDTLLHKEHFLHTVTENYWYYNQEKLNYQTYLVAQKNKLDFNYPILKDNSIIEVLNFIPPLTYYKEMYNVIISALNNFRIGGNKINGLSFENFSMLKDYFSTIFTDDSLLNNELKDNLVVDLSDYVKQDNYAFRNHPDREAITKNPIKKYQKGMKLTRFFTSFLELLNVKDKDTEKTIGRFRIDPSDKVKIFISAYLPSFIKAGAIGNSCLSQGGVNEHSTFMTMGYKNVLLVHDNDFEFRAWLAIDHSLKYYTLAHTYPRENFFLQLVVHQYLKSLGYTPVRNYFRFPEYMDMGAAQNFRDDSIELNEENRDAYYDFSEGLFKFNSYDTPGRSRITVVYNCTGCDKTSVNPSFLEEGNGEYCEACYNDSNDEYGDCSSCGERHHNDYLFYDDENEEYYCEGCRNNIEEEREERRIQEEEEQNRQDEQTDEENGEGINTNQEEISFSDVERVKTKLNNIDLQIGTNLVKRHTADNFYAAMPLIKRLPNFITENDINILSTQRSKISNFREFTIFTTMMESIGINWNDDSAASKFNPIKQSNLTYPYYLVVRQNSDGIWSLQYNQRGEVDGDTIQRTNSEMYLRYFYLGKNRLQLIKEGSNLYEGALSNATDLAVDEKLSVVQKPFSYADLHKVLPLDRSSRVSFKDAEAYDIFMFIAHQVGFMWNTKVPLWGRAMPTLNKGFDSNYFYVVNNKGFLETYRADEGAFPVDTLVLTKEIMHNFLKFGSLTF